MYLRQLLTGTPGGGRQIPIVRIATPGDLIHTAGPGPVTLDVLYLWAANVGALAANLTVEWGGVLAPGDHLVSQFPLAPYSGRILICSGEVLNNGLVVRAFASLASAINVGGYVDRIL